MSSGGAKRLGSLLFRLGLGGSVVLLVLAVLRWAPVDAQPVVNVRALPLFAPTLIFAVLAAVTGVERARYRWRPWLAAFLTVAALLFALVLVRGPGGLAAEMVDGHGQRHRLAAGAIDFIASDREDLPHSRRSMLAWQGALRAPSTGVYRLWVDAAGRVSVSIDGREYLVAEGDPVRAGRDVALAQGEHLLRVSLERAGPGPRLRLGWIRPRRDGARGSWSETIPPRHLGDASPALWFLTDLLALTLALLAGILVFLVPWEIPRPLPAPRPLDRREIALSLLGHAVLVSLMSWPLIIDLAGQGPLQRPDGRLNAWILAWDIAALTHHPSRVFDAPIFHPLPDALTFTENLLLPAVLVAPAVLLGNPVLGYNLAFLLSAVLSGLGAQLIARRVSGDRLAAFVGGAAFAVGAHRWFRMAHLHVQMTLFFPFVLLAFDRFFESRTVRRALLLGLLLALQGWSSVYLGAITATALAVASAVAILSGLSGRDLVRLAIGLLFAALLLAPVTRPYLRMRAFQGQEFTLEEQERSATNLVSYAASASSLYGPATARQLDHLAPRDPLFPGLFLLGLGVAGLAVAPRRFQLVALSASLVAVVVSLGPQTEFYRALHEHVVLFHGVRALSRFSLIPVLALSVLTGLALAGQRFWRLIALVLLLGEASQIPMRYVPYRPPSPAAHWLAGQEGAVADLPLGPERDTDVMLAGLAHLRPLLNGDSGFIPRPYDRSLELLDGPLSDDALRFLRAVGVRHLVSREDHPLPLRARFGDERIYEVPEGDLARVVQMGSPIAAEWGVDGVTADLESVRIVERIQCELADGPFVVRPSVRLSRDGRSWEEILGSASLADATLSLYRDPRRALGEVRFAPSPARFVKLDPRFPCRPGVLSVSP